MENYFHKVYKSFTMEILRIFSINIIISILTSILIIIITFKVSKSIGNPIKKLKETVIDIQNNINNEKTEDAKDKEKFQGFTQQENFNEDKRQIDNAYNNISYMKMNNLIVQEEKIMEETNKKVHTIFSYDSIINEIRTDTYKNDYTDCKNLNLIYKNNNNNDDDNIDNFKKYEIEDFLIEIETIKKKNRRKTNSSSINNEGHPKKVEFSAKTDISIMKKPQIISQMKNYLEKKEKIKSNFKDTKTKNLGLNYYMINSLMNRKNNESSNTDFPAENHKKIFEYDKIITGTFKKNDISKMLDLCDKFYKEDL